MDFVLPVEARDSAGRAVSRRLRREGKVPAIVYGGGQDPRSVTLDHDKLIHQMDNESFYTSILTIKTGKESEPVVVKAVQRHPARHQIMHLDFQRIVAGEAITLPVPVHFLNEETSVGVKTQGGVVEHLMTDVEITCLPKDLPEFIEVDVSAVELGDIIHLSDLKLPEAVTLVALEHGNDQAVFAIQAPRRVEEEAEETAVEADTTAGEAESEAGDES